MGVIDLVGNKLGLMDDAIITSIDSRGMRIYGESIERSYKVQFNPSELTMDASIHVEPMADAERASTLGSEAVTPLRVDNPQIFLTVRLIFDEMVPEGVFMSNDVPISVAGATKGLANKAKDSLSGRQGDRSVQPVVEGFIGAIRNSDTRLLRFNWGEFRFTGFLQHIHAEYVMFSPKGDPVRAYVTLRLKNDLDSDTEMWWEEILALEEGMGLGFDKVKSAAGGVLNINW
ncbi:MAG: hypothetical protein LBO70_04040 [Clostridiales Family XIII bacterium]|jgi:hypothetical protein|nr:hypothetical protein [Clostridiales Family XIII bacterium]